MSNLINLSILGIQFESETHLYRDDGFIADVHKHAAKVYKEFGDDPDAYARNRTLEEGKLPLASGLTLVHPTYTFTSVLTHVISFYQHCDSALKEIFVRGHEETHVLFHTERHDLIQKILAILGLNTDIKAYSDVELIADIGGLYAVIWHGFDSSSIISFLSKRGKTILEIYQNLIDQNKRQFF